MLSNSLEEVQGSDGGIAGSKAARSGDSPINCFNTSSALFGGRSQAAQRGAGLGDGVPVSIEVGSTVTGAGSRILAEDVLSLSGAVRSSGGSGGFKGRLAIGAALKTVRVGTLIVDIMNIGNGDLETRLSICNELATVLKDLTKTLHISVRKIGRNANIQLFVILAKSVSAGIRANSFTRRAFFKNAIVIGRRR